MMKDKPLASFLFAAVLVALTSTAIASTKWYVNGVSGSDSNTCTSPTTVCKTVGHAISLAASGDSIRVAAATYPEHLTIGISLANHFVLNQGGPRRYLHDDLLLVGSTAHCGGDTCSPQVVQYCTVLGRRSE